MATGNILQIAAEVSVDTLKAGMESSVSSVKTAAAGMSDAFKQLAAESEEATTKISNGWVTAAGASVELSKAKDQVRSASRAAKQAEDDERSSLAVLAVAQQRAAEAAKQLADAHKAIEEASNKGGGAASRFGELLKEFVERPMATLGDIAKEGATSFGAVGIAAVGITGAFVAAGYEAVHLVGEFGEATRQAENLANRLGITTAQALQLSAEAKLVGVEVSSLATASFRLGAALESPTGEGKKAADALHQLGVQMFTATGESRELGPVLLDTLEALSRITNEAERAAIAHVILGRASKEIIPLIKNHQDLKQIVRELGVGLDEEETAALMRADKAARQLGLTWEETKRTLAAKIAPIVVPILMEVTQSLKGGAAPDNPKNPVVPDPYANELRTTTEAMAKMSAEHRAKIIDATAKAVAEMLAPIAETAELAAAFKRTFDASKEGLEAQLKSIKEERGKLAAVLQSGAIIDPGTYEAKQSEYDKLTADQGRIEALLKKGKDNSYQLNQLELSRQEAHQKALFELQRDRVDAEAKLGQITVDQKFVLDQRIADQEIAVVRDLNSRKLALAQADPDKGAASARIQNERLELDDAYTLKTQRNAEAILEAKKRINAEEEKDLNKLMEEMEKLREKELLAAQKVANELNLERARAHEIELRGEEAHQGALANLKKVDLENQLILHQLTKRQYDALLLELEKMERAHQLRVLNDELLSLDISAKNYLQSKQGVLSKIQALEDRAALEQAKIAQDTLKLQQGAYAKVFDPIARATEQNVMAMLRGQETLRQGMAKIGQDILLDWIQMLARKLLMQAEHAAIGLLLHTGTKEAEVAVDASAAAQSIAISAASSIKEVTHAAAAAAAKAYQAMAGIPVIGPALGAVVAAATFVAVEGFGALISAERGAVVPSDSLALLHANEMVLPRAESKMIQTMAAGGGGGQEMHFHFAPNVNGIDGPSIDRMLDTHAKSFVRMVKQQFRNGAFA
jgi:hypothetical protein